MLFRFDLEDGEGDDGPDPLAGPEDSILGGKYSALNRVIYNVVSADIRREQRIWQDPWEDLTEDYNKGFRILDLISYVINHLGIPEVGDLAREAQPQILRTKLHNHTGSARSAAFSMLEDQDKVELLTRAYVKAEFVETMKGRVRGPEAVLLRDILFDFAYPAPPLQWFNCASSS
ncbi:hypothetical protein OQA88_3231 [Cercophora sp. LCS_1]